MSRSKRWRRAAIRPVFFKVHKQAQPRLSAGDPRPATPAKGEALTRIVVERLAGFLQELAASPLDETFPY